MAQIDIPEGRGLERERLFALQPSVGMAMGAYAEAVYTKMSLPAGEREVARVRIASLNGCPVCLNTRSGDAVAAGFDEEQFDQVVSCSIGTMPSLDGLTERERLAGEFAERFATDHHSIDDSFMAQIRSQFSDTEVVELAALCAMTVGNGRFLTVLGVAADDDGHYWLNQTSADSSSADSTSADSTSADSTNGVSK